LVVRSSVSLGRDILVFEIHYKRRSQLHAQRGEGRFKAIVFTVLVVFGAYAAYKLLPPYFAEYQLADKMQEEARFAVVNRHGEEQIREAIFKEAQDLEIPITKESIKVFASLAVVRISVDYTIPVDLLVYKVELHFTPSSENKSIT
jgi:type III secretion system FlhB-like substrate exporter